MMEMYHHITERFRELPSLAGAGRISGLSIQNLFQEMPPEDAISKAKSAVSDHVDWAIKDGKLTAYQIVASDLVECLKIAVIIVPKPRKKLKITVIDEEEKRRRFLIREVDDIFRGAFIKLLKKSFDDRAWKKGVVVLEGLNQSLEVLRDCEDEAIFSNWLDDLREFYKERLVVELDNITGISYNKEFYMFVVEFSSTFSLPIQESLKIHEGIFTLKEGLQMVAEIIEEEIEKPRRFRTPEDDHADPTPISIIVEPLMRGIRDCAKLLSECGSQKADSQIIEYLWEKMCSLLFLVLKKYRDINYELNIDRLGLSWSSIPSLIKAREFPLKLGELLNFPQTRRFDYILSPIISALKNNRNAFDEETILSLFNASLASYRIQRPLYGRIRDELRWLCLECIDCISGDLRTRMMLSLTRELISPPQQNDDMDAVYGFQLVGRLIHELGEKQEFLTLLQKEIAFLEGVEAPSFLIRDIRVKPSLLEFVYMKNKEIANWEPPQEEEIGKYKKWHPKYTDWEINASKIVVELFDRFQNSEKQ